MPSFHVSEFSDRRKARRTELRIFPRIVYAPCIACNFVGLRSVVVLCLGPGGFSIHRGQWHGAILPSADERRGVGDYGVLQVTVRGGCGAAGGSFASAELKGSDENERRPRVEVGGGRCRRCGALLGCLGAAKHPRSGGLCAGRRRVTSLHHEFPLLGVAVHEPDLSRVPPSGCGCPRGTRGAQLDLCEGRARGIFIGAQSSMISWRRAAAGPVPGVQMPGAFPTPRQSGPAAAQSIGPAAAARGFNS